MKASSRLRAPRAAISSAGAPVASDAAGVHQRNPIAAGGLVHEMRRDEDRHALIAGKVDQQFPKEVPGEGIDPRGGFVEDEDLGFMDDRDGQGQALSDPEWQRRGLAVHIFGQSKAVNEGIDPRALREPATDETALHARQDSGER